MTRETHFLNFWRALGPGVTLGTAARAWNITRNPGQALWLLAPSRRHP